MSAEYLKFHQQRVFMPDYTAALHKKMMDEIEDRLTAYLQAYNQAAGEFLEYVYQRPRPLDGTRLWENS